MGKAPVAHDSDALEQVTVKTWSCDPVIITMVW